jgi:pimeloyl-ACP methyl ester carboxylesterase
MRRKKFHPLLEPATISLLAGGLTILALDVARRIFRHTQIFCPEKNPVKSWNPADYGIPIERTTQYWIDTPDGAKLFAWYLRAEHPIASAVFCHGNTGNLTNVAHTMPHLLDAGYNVLLFDYRGFGRSTGRPSLHGVVQDGIIAARFHDAIRPQSLPSILYGYSLGGAIAAQMLRHHPFDALILQSTFTTLPELKRAVYPRIPLHLVAGDFFNTLRIVRKLAIPLLVMHGAADEVVPSSMAQALHDACPSPKQIHTVEGALHKDMFDRDADSLVWAMNQFVAQLTQRGAKPAVEDDAEPRRLAFGGVIRSAPVRHA